MTHSRQSTLLVTFFTPFLGFFLLCPVGHAAPKDEKAGEAKTAQGVKGAKTGKASPSKSKGKPNAKVAKKANLPAVKAKLESPKKNDKPEAVNPTAPEAERAAASKTEAGSPPASTPQRTEMSEGITYADVHYKYKLNTLLGVQVLTGTGWSLAVGGQFGYAPFPTRPFYVGPEIGLALGSPGYTLHTLAGAWYELRVPGAPRLSLGMGMLAGVTFASNTPGLNDVGATLLLDLALGQDINELVTVRGQIRPGIIGRYGAVQINFSVQFRFE